VSEPGPRRAQSGRPAGCTLTARQAEILAWIDGQIARNGYPPTRQEIADAFGFAFRSGVATHLRLIESKGFIRHGGSRRLAGNCQRSLAIARRRDGDRVLIAGEWYRFIPADQLESEATR